MVGIPRLKGYFRCYFLALSVFFFQEPSLVKSSALFLPLLVSSAFAATPGPVYPNESRTAITLVAPRQEPCGVRIEGTFPVGPTSTGAGVLKVTNLGQKPIAALRGATRFYFSGSEAQEVTWGSLTVGVRHIRTGFIAPGKSTDVPSGGMRYSGKGGIYRAEGAALPLRLDIVAPLVQTGRPARGALVLRTDPQRLLFPMLASWPVPSDSGETLLWRRDGDGAVLLSGSRHAGAKPMQRFAPLAQLALPAAGNFLKIGL